MMFRLPVSGLEVVLRQPAGVEDLLLLETPGYDTDLALALVTRLASRSDGTPTEWGTLTVTDLDALLLRLRQLVFGDVIRADVLCTVKDCGARIDVSFRITDYLAHHTPHAPRGVEAAPEAGWFRVQGQEIMFRLPSGLDQAAVAGMEQPERELIRRCVRPAELPARWLRRVERAMEALAPSLSHALQGSCPQCRTKADIYFEVQRFVLQELRDQAAFLYEDVHLLARHYHWAEEKILALPRYRRVQYADRLRQERSPS